MTPPHMLKKQNQQVWSGEKLDSPGNNSCPSSKVEQKRACLNVTPFNDDRWRVSWRETAAFPAVCHQNDRAAAAQVERSRRPRWPLPGLSPAGYRFSSGCGWRVLQLWASAVHPPPKIFCWDILYSHYSISQITQWTSIVSVCKKGWNLGMGVWRQHTLTV